jgi:phage-related protein
MLVRLARDRVSCVFCPVRRSFGRLLSVVTRIFGSVFRFMGYLLRDTLGLVVSPFGCVARILRGVLGSMTSVHGRVFGGVADSFRVLPRILSVRYS